MLAKEDSGGGFASRVGPWQRDERENVAAGMQWNGIEQQQVPGL